MKHRRRTDRSVVQIEVDCPRWVQRRMWTNLRRAKEDKVAPERASTANMLLEQARRKHESATPEAPTQTTPKTAPANVAQHVTPRGRTARSGVWQSAKAGLRKWSARLSGLLRSKRVLQLAHNRDIR